MHLKKELVVLAHLVKKKIQKSTNITVRELWAVVMALSHGQKKGQAGLNPVTCHSRPDRELLESLFNSYSRSCSSLNEQQSKVVKLLLMGK